MDIAAVLEVKKEMNGAETGAGASPGDGDENGSGKHCLSSRSFSSFCFFILTYLF